MFQSNNLADEIPPSVAWATQKARASRIQRLMTTLAERLDHPIAVVDSLMAEMATGELRPELWEYLHRVATRDKVEAALADAYVKCADGPRMKRLAPEAQAAILMHAADFFQGVRGDLATAHDFLERVLRVVPGHAAAFARLERRLEEQLDARGLLVLYGKVAAVPPKPAHILANQAHLRLLQITGKAILSDETCTRLLALVPHNPRLLGALESHCRATNRHKLARALIEETLVSEAAEIAQTVGSRRRILELCLAERETPAELIVHVEVLLKDDPSDEIALKAAQRLLGRADLASRAATALQTARRRRNHVR